MKRISRVLPLALALSVAAVHATAQAPEAVTIYYQGADDAVKQALTLTSYTRLTDEKSSASVIVVNDVKLSPEELEGVAQSVSYGTGLLLFLGANITETDLSRLGLVGITLSHETIPATLEPAETDSPSVANVNWRVAPQIRARCVPEGDVLTPLVMVHDQGSETVLAEARIGAGTVFLVAPAVMDETNAPFRDWFYFNYLVYALAAAAAGETPSSFADYPGSPVPHETLQWSTLAVLVLMLGSTLLAFAFVRRYSKRHPEAITQLVADTARFETAEATSEWEQVGFHRGIASLMVAILNSVWLFVPVSILTNVVLFGIILPSAQIRGAMSLVLTFFGTIWTLMDWGTAVAGQKFLSQYRVTKPAEGMKYVQFFVWWQAITGTIQVGAIAVVALFILPDYAVAYLSMYVLLHVLIQFPGFGQVFNAVVFPGLHRFDYQQVIGTMLAVFGPILQIVACVAAVSWGKRHPIYNSLAGGFGLGLGALVLILLVFLTGLFLYRRMGMAARVVFLAHFDWNVVKKALVFGAPITGIGLFYTGAFSVQVWLLSRLVLNYAEVQANFDVAFSLGTGTYAAVLAMTVSMLSSYSEAYPLNKFKLCRYYITASLKWGQLLCMFLMAVMLAVGDRFILGSLPAGQYDRAILWMKCFAIWWLLAPTVWTCDQALVGIGKPYLQLVSMMAEQGARIIFMLILAPKLQAWGMVVAYLCALPTKALVDVLFVRRNLGRIYVCWWQSVFAPLLSAGVIFVLLRVAGDMFWRPTPLFSSALFAAGLVGALPVHFFLTGLFGGWDRHGLFEFRRAVPLCHVAKPMAWLLFVCTKGGASISPLHDRFPVATYEEAMAEAEEVTATKVRLDDEANRGPICENP